MFPDDGRSAGDHRWCPVTDDAPTAATSDVPCMRMVLVYRRSPRGRVRSPGEQVRGRSVVACRAGRVRHHSERPGADGDGSDAQQYDEPPGGRRSHRTPRGRAGLAVRPPHVVSRGAAWAAPTVGLTTVGGAPVRPGEGHLVTAAVLGEVTAPVCLATVRLATALVLDGALLAERAPATHARRDTPAGSAVDEEAHAPRIRADGRARRSLATMRHGRARQRSEVVEMASAQYPPAIRQV